jgi:hypothetical protein
MIRKKTKRRNPYANSLENLKAQIEKEWNNKPKMDWLQLETSIREVYIYLDREEITKAQALSMIAEIIEVYTRRGPVKGY